MKSTDVILITGMRGSGKSYFMSYLTKQSKVPFIIYDGATHEHGKLGGVCTDVSQFPQKLKGNIVYQPLDDTEEDFSAFCRVVWQNYTNCIVVIEEIANYTTSNYIDRYFSRLCRIGRHKGIGVIGITQRPARLSLIYVSQCSHLFIFKQYLPQDIKFLSEYVGDTADKVAKLEKYHFIHFSDGQVTEHPPIKLNTRGKEMYA